MDTGSTVQKSLYTVHRTVRQNNRSVVTSQTGMLTTCPLVIPVDVDIAKRNRCIICHSEDYIVLQRTGQRCAIRNNIISGNRCKINNGRCCSGRREGLEHVIYPASVIVSKADIIRLPFLE